MRLDRGEAGWGAIRGDRAWEELLLGETTPESGLSPRQPAWHDGSRLARLEEVHLRKGRC